MFSKFSSPQVQNKNEKENSLNFFAQFHFLRSLAHNTTTEKYSFPRENLNIIHILDNGNQTCPKV